MQKDVFHFSVLETQLCSPNLGFFFFMYCILEQAHSSLMGQCFYHRALIY